MNINISINFFLGNRHLKESMNIDLDNGRRIKEAIKVLGNKLKVDLIPILIENPRNTLLLVNGQSLKIPDDLDRELCDQDQLTILQAIGGG